MTVLLVALGAAVGAPIRFAVASRLDGAWPSGTLLVNLAGSLVLGLLAGLSVGPDTAALLGTGWCGGLTTYSSFAVQTHDRGRRTGAAYAVVTVVGALAAATAGYLLGQA